MKRIRVLYVSSELAPLVGDGERGEVTQALSAALTAQKVAVTVVAPVDRRRDPERWGVARRLDPLMVATPTGTVPVTYYEGSLPNGGVEVVLADCGERPAPELLARVAFTLAAQRQSWPSVVHVGEDTAAVAQLARSGDLTPAETAPPAIVVSVDAPAEITGELSRALAVADRIALGSPTYAGELLASAAEPTSSELARALEPMRARVRGIAHGTDDARWNPARDNYLPAQFSAADLAGKAECKLELQRELALPPRPRTPLIGVRGPFRLLSAETADAIAAADVQIVFLIDPARDRDIAGTLRDVALRHPTRVAACSIADPAERERMAHRLVAGSDFDLRTDTFSPRGHSELYFLAYGSVPIAPRCGGFGDAMVDFDRITGTGNAFLYSRDGEGLVSAVFRAARAYRTPHHQALVLRAFAQDLSWRTAARRYSELYREALASADQNLATPVE